MNLFEFVKFSINEEHKSISALLDQLEDNLLQTPIGKDDTIGKRLMHMTSAEYQMAMYLVNKEGDENKEFPLTVEGLCDSFKRSKQRHLHTIDNLSAEDLDNNWISKRSGKEYSYTWLLYHFIEHLSTHRGQVTTALRLVTN